MKLYQKHNNFFPYLYNHVYCKNMSDSKYLSLSEVSGVDISHDNTSIGKSGEQFERYVKVELTILLP